MTLERNWRKKLSYTDRKHLKKDAGCRTRAQVVATLIDALVAHADWVNTADSGPFLGCWDCVKIARSLGLTLSRW